MRITAIETTRIKTQPNLLWVEIETDAGIIGLGETFRGAEAVETALKAARKWGYTVKGIAEGHAQIIVAPAGKGRRGETLTPPAGLHLAPLG